jgi:sulfide dehydrogenase [flavocytochrome c] flavoprotein chain
LFVAGWQQHYGDMIEWVSSTRGGQVEEIDAANLTAISDSGLTTFKADVLNYIPPQTAGAIALQTGLAGDGFWCPVNQLTFESSIHPHIYVIGDSSVAGAMPKSGHSANNQAKVAAAAIVRDLAGQEPLQPSTANTCYSLITPDHAISVAAVYAYIDGAIAAVPNSGGVSPADAPAAFRQQEAIYTKGWYDGITADIWG